MADDYISRQAAIDAVEKKIRYTDHDEPVVDWNDFVAALCFLPSADVRQNVRGEWIPYEFGDETWHKCSNCGIADQYGFKYLSFNGTKNIIYSVRNRGKKGMLRVPLQPLLL